MNQQLTIFVGEIPEGRTPRSCCVCQKPATTELYKAIQRGPKRGQVNLSSRIFVCSACVPGAERRAA